MGIQKHSSVESAAAATSDRHKALVEDAAKGDPGEVNEPRRRHTPGPWHAQQISYDEGQHTRRETLVATLDDPQRELGARKIVTDGPDANPLSMEDARLIAKAPELLEMLREARAALPDAWAAVDCDVPRELVEQIDATIREAEG